MQSMELLVMSRQPSTKGALRRIRREGRIPGVVYGRNGAVAVAVSGRDLEKILSSETGVNTLLSLKIQEEGKEFPAIIREIQRHPVQGNLIHVDFYQVSLNQPLQTDVPVNMAGESEGVKAGGVLQHGVRTVTVECLPTDIPEAIEVDISKLGIGDKITVADLTPPQGVTIISDPDTVIASILAPAVAAPEGETAEEEGAEADTVEEEERGKE